MHDLYAFVSGPLVWVAFIIFFGGSIYRLVSMALLAKKKDGVVFEYFNFKYALRSILHWIIPFASTNWRLHPWMTIVTFAFHICLIFTPVFLFAHIILIKESWDISWWAMPDGLADILTLVVIGSCVFFFIRRKVLPEVKYLTSTSDYVILVLIALPFITGFWTYHQWPASEFMGILHILSGEVMLAVIPFTKLSHMLFFPITRGYMGSEFGGVRQAKDW
jgi:nitrate reductase gamma subunit